VRTTLRRYREACAFLWSGRPSNCRPSRHRFQRGSSSGRLRAWCRPGTRIRRFAPPSSPTNNFDFTKYRRFLITSVSRSWPVYRRLRDLRQQNPAEFPEEEIRLQANLHNQPRGRNEDTCLPISAILVLEMRRAAGAVFVLQQYLPTAEVNARIRLRRRRRRAAFPRGRARAWWCRCVRRRLRSRPH
jgi:hypothetical protein